MNELLFSLAPFANTSAEDGPSMPAMTIDQAASTAAEKKGEAGDAKASTQAKNAAAKKAAIRKAVPTSKPAPAKKVAPAKKASMAIAPASAESPKSGAAGKPAKKAPKLRPQLVRDSFTMPEADFGLIAVLKAKALDARRAAKKSELLRAGLRLLAGLEAKALAAALDKLEPVKVGRPKKGR